jgi:hypothetical protein
MLVYCSSGIRLLVCGLIILSLSSSFFFPFLSIFVSLVSFFFLCVRPMFPPPIGVMIAYFPLCPVRKLSLSLVKVKNQSQTSSLPCIFDKRPTSTPCHFYPAKIVAALLPLRLYLIYTYRHRPLNGTSPGKHHWLQGRLPPRVLRPQPLLHACTVHTFHQCLEVCTAATWSVRCSLVVVRRTGQNIETKRIGGGIKQRNK